MQQAARASETETVRQRSTRTKALLKLRSVTVSPAAKALAVGAQPTLGVKSLQVPGPDNMR
jgi:hypothetical protein